MTEIARESLDPRKPYANLLPLVDALVRSGNTLADGGFVVNPDGWRCRFTQRLDIQFIGEQFKLPGTVQVSEEYDTILDRLTWCSIEGPGAH